MRLIYSILTSVFLLCYLFCLVCPLQAEAQGNSNADVRGFVYNKKTGEPVIFTPVLLEGTSHGVLTDVNGYFNITRVPAGTYILVSSAIGFDTLKEEVTIKAGDILTRKLFLSERSTELKEVEIKGTKSRAARINTVNASLTQVTPREIKMMPSVGGEPDIAQYLQTIPGVVSTGDQGGQIYIRGGTPVQNLVLLDGMIIYNPFHSIGLFSVFDTELIKNADVYTGGFGAEYGGRASAVMDVRTIDGNKNRLAGRFGITPFTARLMFEGPLGKVSNDGTGTTFILSGRTSYLDKTSKTFYPYAKGINGSGLPFSFTDLYGKVTFSLSGGNKASLFGFNFNDKARLGTGSNFDWTSYGLGGNFLLLSNSSGALITGNFAYSRYDIGISEDAALPRSSTVDGFNGGLDFTYNFNKDELRYGLGIVGNNSSFRGVTPSGLHDSLTNYNTEVYGYTRYKWQPGKFIIEPGFRFHYYASLSTPSLEPRLGIKYKVNERLRLKMAAGLYSQNLFSTTSDRDVVNLFTGYITSPDQVYSGNKKVDDKLQRAQHLITGFEYDISDEIEVSVEPYLKYFNQFVNINRDKKNSDDPQFIQETSLARGIDLMVKYEHRNLFLQVGYSLSKVTRTNNDTTYFPIFDRRHNLNVLGGWHFGKNNAWELDMRYNLGSGFPFTQTMALYENQTLPGGSDANYKTGNGNLGIYYGNLTNFNKGRLPYYHRLDITLKRKYKFSENATLELAAGATNVYNRDNIFYVNRLTQAVVYQLPILPTIGATLIF